ncbi:hypothetical protein SAMN05216266_120114 [Amycolatopsis marina]|uniref:Lipoprotein n=1 Tax=Amycolatopsis marina TaxID=490629 RepID=A0A1I1C3A8_9PSEU|nr:hypothetical protein [Amycolatopsis marina]SFB57119.1 hypothetical protein SAMN05216266_120114 [Amycolatopsis marina]
MKHIASVPLVAIGLACALVLSGCSEVKEGGGDALQVVADPVAATAAVSPATTAEPEGTVLPAEKVTALAVDSGSRTLAVAVQQPPSVLLHDLDAPGAKPRTVSLPGQAASLAVQEGQFVASVPGAGSVVWFEPSGTTVRTAEVAGAPVASASHDGRSLVAVRDRKAIEVLDGETVTKTISGELYSADQVVTAGGHTVVLDRLRTALFEVDVEAGTVDVGLRAGQGATNAVADPFGRVLVTDTRAGSLLAFSTEPLLLRQRYPVPGGVYAIASDAKRKLAWVTLTGRNEVVGFDLRGGEPEEKYRFPTVRQPNSVAVDDRTGQVVVGSAAGEGIQVIAP